MTHPRKYVISIAAVALVGSGMLLAGTRALAEEVTTTYPIIVQNIAEKFNLDPADVQLVFDETKQERQDERMNQLVEDGVITEEQKTLIETRMDQFQADREEIANQSMTMEEHRTAMQELRTELQAWADENDIPQIALRIDGMGPGGHGGRGFGGPEMGMDSVDPETL